MDTEDSPEAILKLAALVETNCEFLTSLRHASPRTELIRNSQRTLDEYWEERGASKLNNQAMLQLIVELVYFYFACKTNKARPVITSNNVRVEETTLRNSEKRFSIIVWYELNEGEPEDGFASSSLVELISYLSDKLDEYLQQRKEERDRPAPESEQEQAIETFFLQFRTVASSDALRENEGLFFMAVEQTNIFYEHSLFYRIKNCSILDFIRSEESRFSLFRAAKAKDEYMVVEYNKEKRGKSEQEVLRRKEREIEDNISQFFKVINEKNYYEIQAKNEKEKAEK